MTKKTGMVLSADSKTNDMLEALNAQIEKIKHIETTKWKAGEDLPQFGNIRKEMKIENLIRAGSMVQNMERAYDDYATKTLKLKSYPKFTIGNGGSADWDHDIALRIEIINHKETLDKLNGFKTQIEGLLSDQEKKELIVAQLADFLSGSPATEVLKD